MTLYLSQLECFAEHGSPDSMSKATQNTRSYLRKGKWNLGEVSSVGAIMLICSAAQCNYACKLYCELRDRKGTHVWLLQQLHVLHRVVADPVSCHFSAHAGAQSQQHLEA